MPANERTESDKRILAGSYVPRKGRPGGIPGINRGHEAEFMYKYRLLEDQQDITWDDGFETPMSGGGRNSPDRHTERFDYCSKHGYMKVTFSKTGRESNVVVYDSVSPHTFMSFKVKALRDGRCGKMLWDEFRRRGTGTQGAHKRGGYWHV